MDQRPLRDDQAIFDVSLQAAHRRITDLQADGRATAATGAALAGRRPGVRYALGVRLLALGAALVADEPLLGEPRRPLVRG